MTARLAIIGVSRVKQILLVASLVLAGAPAFAQGSLESDLRIARAHYPTPMSAAQQAALLNEVAWKHQAEGWGLLSKPSGNNCPAPGGALVSCDYLVFAPTGQGFDVLQDAEGAGNVTWSRGDSFDRSRFVAPVAPAGGPVTPPPPDPPPAGGSTVLERVTALQARTEGLAEALQAQDRKLDAIQQQLAAAQVALEQASAGLKFPTYTAVIFGSKVVLTPKP